MDFKKWFDNKYFETELGYIINGDCLNEMKKIPDKSINMILCDLPYGSTQNKWDIIIPFELLWHQYKRIIKENGAIVLTCNQPFTSMLLMSNNKLFRYSLVWEKTTPTGHLNAKKMPLRIHEDILVFYKKLPTYNPQKTAGHKRKVSKAEHKINCVKTSNYGTHGLTTYDSTERYPTSVLKFKTDKQKHPLHPTQKPVALFEWLINTYTNEYDLVLDNTAGVVTTGLASENLNRRWICIEKEIDYCEKGKSRF